jgi:hypothetical protein
MGILSFTEYLKKHDPCKARYAALWERGKLTIPVSTIVYSADDPSRGKQGSVTVTQRGSAGAPSVTFSLPYPHNNGVGFDTFGKMQAQTCNKYLEAEHPWLHSSYSKRKVIEMAKASPGRVFMYDGGHGYWRSSIDRIISNYSQYVRTGTDPCGSTGDASNKKRKRASVRPKEAATEVEEEHLYAEEEDDEPCVPQAAAASVEIVATAKAVIAPVEGVPLRPPKKIAGKDPELYKPPNPVLQNGRYAVQCEKLVAHLKRKDLWKEASERHWKEAKRFLTKTIDGRDYIKGCGLDPDGVQLDHIHPQNTTPIHHVYNMYIMPSSVNSHFKDRFDDEKKNYIGALATRMSIGFKRFYIREAGKLKIDCSKFNNLFFW